MDIKLRRNQFCASTIKFRIRTHRDNKISIVRFGAIWQFDSLFFFFFFLRKNFRNSNSNPSLNTNYNIDLNFLNIFNSISLRLFKNEKKIKFNHCCTLRFLISRRRGPCESRRRRGAPSNKSPSIGNPRE